MNIAELQINDKDRLVIYKQGTDEQEEGVITSWNDRFVFVRYGGDNHSKATYPQDLTFSLK